MEENGDSDIELNDTSSDENNDSFRFLEFQDDQESQNDDGEEERHFDITLAATHSYMGSSLVAVSGRRVLEAGWRGVLPALAHHGAVFPGESVPLLLPPPDAAALRDHRLFGLLCPDETGTYVSGYGVLCEILETSSDPGVGDEGGDGAPGADADRALMFKARANHRFRFVNMPKRGTPIRHYSRMRSVEVVVLPELPSRAPLRHAALAALHSRRPLGAGLRRLEAAVSAWPAFVFEPFDYSRVRPRLQRHAAALLRGRRAGGDAAGLPEDSVSLSFWVASNLALSPRDRLALLRADCAGLRLHTGLRLLDEKSALCCASCMTEIAQRENIFAMSSEGAHSNYTNPGGFLHDIMTVTTATNTALQGAPSAQFSWFPGYCWRVALCRACGAHVGWRFTAQWRSLRPRAFYGLCRNTVQPRPSHSHSPSPTRTPPPAESAAPPPGRAPLAP